jgi:hypothetical protein
MCLTIVIDHKFLFRAPALCLICMWLALGSPAMAYAVSPANEHFVPGAGQPTRLAQLERSETKTETGGTTDSKNISEIKMMQKRLQDEISAIAKELKELGKTLWYAERRTAEFKLASYRFETYFKVIMIALGVIIGVANVVLLLFFFRRRRQIVRILGITYDAAIALAAVRDRQLQMASLINELQEQIEVLGIQGVPEVNSSFTKLAELLQSSEKDLVSLGREMRVDGTHQR